VSFRQILAGIETEYGFLVEDRGPKDQVSDAAECVRSWPGQFFAGWNYQYESPRNDLRGFKLAHLAVDPEDWKFETNQSPSQSSAEVRSDRVLATGARFYNDHGHPEFSTPECLSLDDLVAHDLHGEVVVAQAARAYAEQLGRSVKVYKNNSDFHGASYGTHENYLVPREVGFERLFAGLTPLLVARTILCGAGKVGSEAGDWCDFQLSQRADFFVEAANAETLYRRPIFNTRDEPHADPREWIRLHVISGDANMLPAVTRRKVGLMRLAIRLTEIDRQPKFSAPEPVKAIQRISRALAAHGSLTPSATSWGDGDAFSILRAYLDAAAQYLELDSEDEAVISESHRILGLLESNDADLPRDLDWAAKRWVIDQHHITEGGSWRDAAAQSLDLAFTDVDPDEGLRPALVEMGIIDPVPPHAVTVPADTRAAIRGLFVEKFADSLVSASWSSLVATWGGNTYEVNLDPRLAPPGGLDAARTPEEFFRMISAQ
jgi:proteasome accessory factor A